MEERIPYLLKSSSNGATLESVAYAEFVEVRAPNGKLAFRFDPVRLIVEWQDRGTKHYFDLMAYDAHTQR